MPRVLHCIYDDPGNPWVGGGGALRVWEVYRRLTDTVHVTVASGNFPGARDEARDGVHYIRLGAAGPYAWSRLSYARAATRLLARGDYDVGIFDFSAYTPIRLPRGRPVGLVVHMLHGPTAPARWGRIGGGWLAAAERRSIASSRWISTTSHWMREQIERFAAPESRIVVVGSGVAAEFFDVPRSEKDYLLYYGRFDLFQKGLDTLLEAFARTSSEFPTVRLVIAGRGKDGLLVRERAREMGIADRIEVIEGVGRDEVLSLFAGALMMLMPSRLEGLPMAPAEAMAAGVPVIASNVGALTEILGSADAGMLIPPDDPRALAEAVSSLLARREEREKMSLAARHSAARFSWEHVAREHLEFLHLIMAETGGPSIISENE